MTQHHKINFEKESIVNEEVDFSYTIECNWFTPIIVLWFPRFLLLHSDLSDASWTHMLPLH